MCWFELTLSSGVLCNTQFQTVYWLADAFPKSPYPFQLAVTTKIMAAKKQTGAVFDVLSLMFRSCFSLFFLRCSRVRMPSHIYRVFLITLSCCSVAYCVHHFNVDAVTIVMQCEAASSLKSNR